MFTVGDSSAAYNLHSYIRQGKLDSQLFRRGGLVLVLLDQAVCLFEHALCLLKLLLHDVVIKVHEVLILINRLS